jgi:hypothetical protein
LRAFVAVRFSHDKNHQEASLPANQMPALSDPKLEKFSQALLMNIAQGMPRSKAAAAAARTAGYGGSSMAANARKRAALPQVKVRMAELAAPAQRQAESEVVASVEDANRKLGAIAGVAVKSECVKPSDQVAAMNLMARINGWLAPEKTELTSPIKIERIDRVIVDHAKPEDGE